MKIGDEPIRRRCEIALSTFDEHQRRLQENRFTDAVLSCLWLKLVRGVGAYQPIDEMKISGGRSDSRKWTDHRVNWRQTALFSEVFLEIFLRERESEPPPRNLLSASNVGSLALSRRKISRKTSGPRLASNQFAVDLKIVVQVVHTDGQGHSHRRFRGRLCFSLTACRTLKIVLRALRT